MLSFRLKYRTWQDTKIWNQVVISDWGKVQGRITLVANLVYCHFRLSDLVHGAGIHTRARTHRSLLSILLILQNPPCLLF